MVAEMIFVAFATALNSNGLQLGVRILKKQSLPTHPPLTRLEKGILHNDSAAAQANPTTTTAPTAQVAR
jgi:hypothetical protein